MPKILDVLSFSLIFVSFVLTVISSETGIFGHISHLTFKQEKECCSRYLNVSLSIREFFKKMIAWGCMLFSCFKTSVSVKFWILKNLLCLWLGVIYWAWFQYSLVKYSINNKIKHFISTILKNSSYFMKNGNYFCLSKCGNVMPWWRYCARSDTVTVLPQNSPQLLWQSLRRISPSERWKPRSLFIIKHLCAQ